MTVAVRHRIMRIEDFLAWETRQELRFEFDGFEPVGMTGGSFRHSAIQRNLAILVGGRLLGGDCAFYGSDLKVLLEDRVRYPDGQVVCGPHPPTATFTTAPVVVFEVTSPSSSDLDHETKREEYTRLTTLRQYVIIEQHAVRVRLLEREGAVWTDRTLEAGDALLLRAIGVKVMVTELYAGVELD